ncbi:MAG: hypothetical protein V2A65_04900 [Candidatus Omnitrophota bacterium]
MSTRQKIAGFLVLAVLFLGFSVLLVNAEQKKESAPASKKEATAAEKDRKFLEESKKELNNTKWLISTGPLYENVYTGSDVLYFFENQVISREFKEKGYSPTNYSFRLQPDNSIIWETMQRDNKSGDVVFWRGDYYPLEKRMRGSFTKTSKEGKVDSSSFQSTEYSKMEKLPPELTAKPEVKEEPKVATPPEGE